MTAKSITRGGAKVAFAVLTSAIGGLMGLLAAALAYRAWVPLRPCLDMVPPQYIGVCAVPTAPAWLLAIGVVVGAAIPLLAWCFAPLLIRRHGEEGRPI